MKYTILINQKAIVDAGLHVKTDLGDWAILDYIQSWQTAQKAVVKEGHIWINYKHMINEMPLLKLNTKSAISNRIKKLRNLGLIESIQDDDSRLYVKTTDLFYSITQFETKPPVHVSDPPVHVSEPPVHVSEPPVHVSEQSVYNQIIPLDSSSLLLAESEKSCFIWSMNEPFWADKIKNDINKFRHYYNNGRLKTQFENFQAHAKSNGVTNNEKHNRTERKLSTAERQLAACKRAIEREEQRAIEREERERG